jgi:hypothetical protein
MRTVLACFVLAAAIATPGIVVAATSSSSQEHAPSIGFSATILRPTGTAEHGPINPSLRPAVNAVKAAFAPKGIELTVEPLGGEAAAAFAIDPSSHCPTVINFEIGDQSSHLLPGSCSSEASIQTGDGLTISYTPQSVGPTIEQALARLPR